MIKLILTLNVLLVLSACSNSSSSIPATPQTDLEILTNAPGVEDLTKATPANSYRLNQSNLSYDDQKIKYAFGCKTAGEFTPDYKMDPTLEIGSTFVVDHSSINYLENKSHSVSESILVEMSDKKIVYNENYISLELTGTPFTQISDVFSQTPHLVRTETFTPSASGGYPEVDFEFTGNYTPAALEYLQTVSNQPRKLGYHCYIQNGTNLKQTVDLIDYEFASKSIPAFMTRTENKGMVVCTKERAGNDQTMPATEIEIGDGSEVRIDIRTNSVTEQNINMCGGNTIYSSSILKLDSGKIISSNAEKTISAPLR